MRHQNFTRGLAKTLIVGLLIGAYFIDSAKAQDGAGDAVAGAIVGAIVGGAIVNRNCVGVSENSRCVSPLNRERKRTLHYDEASIIANRRNQEDLNAIGFDAGAADGIIGPRTREAISRFQVALGFQPTGALDMMQQGLLNEVALRYRQRMESRLEVSIPELIAELRGSWGGTNEAMVPIATEQPVVPASLGESSFGPEPTRVFGGPGMFPPRIYRGYGILVMENQVAPIDRERHQFICQAFLASMPDTAGSSSEEIDQFVTVWPVKSKEKATRLNIDGPPNEYKARCEIAIDDYNFALARAISRKVAESGQAFDTVGPFLFAWVPAQAYRDPQGIDDPNSSDPNDPTNSDPLIISLDLSSIRSYADALNLFNSWKNEIEVSPELAKDGITVEWIRVMLGRWADQNGSVAVKFIGGD